MPTAELKALFIPRLTVSNIQLNKMEKNMRIGFIGAGNMAGAIIGGVVKSNLVKSENVIAKNPKLG